MNHLLRVAALSAAACALGSAAAADAYGRQNERRGVGNSAEIERRENERRDQTMREADLRERQFLLRNMRPDAAPAGRPTPRLAVAQIRGDFVRLQVLNNELAKAASKGDALDLRFVSRSAEEIRKLATRLRDGLALPESGGDTKAPGAAAAAPPAQLGPALTALDGLILKFAEGLASKGVYLVDAQSSARARRELESIIELSAWVRKTSEKMGKSPGRPR